MNKLPSIVVLLAAYDGELYIQEQLDSILAQENVNISIIISVDKCNDSTLSIVKYYESIYADIISVLPYGKSFGSAGANFTRLICEVDFNNYEYISFADQDDIWLPQKLNRAVEQIYTNNVDAYSSNVTAFWKSGKKKLVKKDYPQVKFDYLFESPGPGCSFLLKNSLAQSLRSHLLAKKEVEKEIWLHDWYCYSFARFYDWKWYIDSQPMMLYRQHELNVVGANTGWNGFFTRIKTILTGDGFNKALDQAEFIGQNDCKPIKLISDKKRLGMFHLSFLAFQCRRKSSHKVFFLVACLFFCLKGFNNNEKK